MHNIRNLNNLFNILYSVSPRYALGAQMLERSVKGHSWVIWVMRVQPDALDIVW